MKKKAYLLFHLNLFFSSIEKKNRLIVIKNCYYPILNIPKLFKIPVNLEASANTLLEIEKLDKDFIVSLKNLISKNLVNLIGSGYNQIISPIIPEEINDQNLKIGNKYYKKIFGLKPKIALINEMAFSKDLIPIYIKNGYKSVIIDIDNISNIRQKEINQKLKKPFTYKGKNLDIIFASSFLFQEFQNCVYGDVSIKSYQKNIDNLKKNFYSILPIYSGDAEIFNNRVKRFKAERIKTHDEWKRVYKILNLLISENNLEFILLNQNREYNTLKNIVITDGANPIIVKKQPKYNISRWAVSGKSSQKINTLCYKFLKNKILLIPKMGKFSFYKTMIDLWSSDYRTHITKKKWSNFLKKINFINNQIKQHKIKDTNNFNKTKDIKSIFYSNEKNFLNIKTKNINLILNIRRGLAIEHLSFESQKFKNFIGTLHRDEINSIYDGFDYYSGNTTHEIISDLNKFSDLKKVKPHIFENEKEIKIVSNQSNEISYIKKIINIKKDKEEIIINTIYKTKKKVLGSLKINNITFLNIDDKRISYQCKNGGKADYEYLLDEFFDHTLPPSKFVSLNNGLGCTDSKIRFKIGKNIINFEWDNSENYVMPCIQYKKVKNKKLLRLFFSNQEYDDTSFPIKLNNEFKLKITPGN